MNSPQQRKPALFPGLLILLLAVTFFLIPTWLPAEFRDQWQWIIVIIQGLLTVALVIFLVMFVRKQRDDYWREQGKDPRYPER